MISVSEQKSFDQRFSMIRTLAPDKVLSREEQTRLTIMDAGAGDCFTCLGRTYIIQEINKYQEASEDYSKLKDYFVTELTCLCLETGAIDYFEWEIDDELEVCITLDQIKFKQLADEDGQPIDEDDLDQIVDDEDTIVYAGKPLTMTMTGLPCTGVTAMKNMFICMSLSMSARPCSSPLRSGRTGTKRNTGFIFPNL